MGRDQDKVIHLFNIRDTLAPKSQEMSDDFQIFFSEFFGEYKHDYAFFSRRSLSSVKRNIPTSILLKCKYTFLNNGINAVVPDKKRLCKLKYTKGEPSLESIISALKKEYLNIYYYTPYTDDRMCHKLDQVHGTSHFLIDEWKDTAIFMKRIIWDIHG